MPLGNWVILEPGKPDRMHFTDHVIEPIPITDKTTGLPTTRNRLALDVDRWNGAPATAKFSTLAEKLYRKLEPYLAGRAYRDYDFVITMEGTGYVTQYSVQVIPLK